MFEETLGGHETFDTGGLWAISIVFSSGGTGKQSSPASKRRSCRYPLKGIVERRGIRKGENQLYVAQIHIQASKETEKTAFFFHSFT